MLSQPRAYHEIVLHEPSKRVYVLGGFDGNSYYRGSIWYDLEQMVSVKQG